MWRLGVLLVAAVLLEFTTAGVQATNQLLIQRLKRSPHYCDSYNQPYNQQPYNEPHSLRHAVHPHPHPPPYWMSQGRQHPPFWRAPPPPPPPPQPPPPPSKQQSQSDPPPCNTCDNPNSGYTAISNAESSKGDAISVAVSRGK